MKEFILVMLLTTLAACSPKLEDEAITCRGGTHTGDSYKLHTVVEVRTDYPTISYAPIRCPNMEMSFHGEQPNSYAAMMASTARQSPGGRATFEVEAVGKLGKDNHLRVPLYAVTKVITLSHVY